MKKILAVSSGGGHWTQLIILTQPLSHYDLRYVTTDSNKALNRAAGFRVDCVPDADITQPFRLCYLALSMAWQVLRRRPDIVVSTGAAPGYFAVLFGKLSGAKTIWVDSIANYSKPSLSGQHALKCCDLYLTQWPQLAAEEGQAKYWGHLI